MNEQKPLSTQDIAAGRNESQAEPDRRDDSDILEPADDASINSTQANGRDSMESGPRSTGMANGGTGQSNAALMPVETAESHRQHWSDIQTHFVDNPKEAVEQADELVAEVIQIVATRFAEQRKGLEGQWQEGGEASSEDLRQAFLQYRSFFERLLAA